MVDEKKDDPKETKTRQRLTVTAMFDAICDLHFAVVGEEARLNQEAPMLSTTLRADAAGRFYVAGILERKQQEPFISGSVIAEGVHPDGIEEAVASLLAKMQERFEAKRKALLADLDSVVGRHHGALRGARSKIREKKT